MIINLKLNLYLLRGLQRKNCQLKQSKSNQANEKKDFGDIVKHLRNIIV